MWYQKGGVILCGQYDTTQKTKKMQNANYTTYTIYTVTINYNNKENKNLEYNYDTRNDLKDAFQSALDKYRLIVSDKADMCAIMSVNKCFYTISITRSIYIENLLSDKEVMRNVNLKNY